MYKRLQNELRDILKDTTGKLLANMIGNDITKWRAIIFGPEDTPYENGTFVLNIEFGKDYPFKPPIVKFVTKVYHPNISLEGYICMDILKDQWSPVLSPTQILLSVCSLLSEPNANDPLNSEAGALYKNNRIRFDAVAKEFTDKFAG